MSGELPTERQSRDLPYLLASRSILPGGSLGSRSRIFPRKGRGGGCGIGTDMTGECKWAEKLEEEGVDKQDQNDKIRADTQRSSLIRSKVMQGGREEKNIRINNES